MKRRKFVRTVVGIGAVGGFSLPILSKTGYASSEDLLVGEASFEITPPVGIELAGFHRSAGKERRIEGTRQPTAVRVLYLRKGAEGAALVSIDILGVSADMTERVRRASSAASQIPSKALFLCSTHTHSMPTFRYLRQWGAIPSDFLSEVEDKIVEAVGVAISDAAPAELAIGQATAIDASFNRTVKEWKTEDAWDGNASDRDRWLDRLLQVLKFSRSGGKPDLLWYHFSAHPVCYADGLSGPDWLGWVGDTIKADLGVTPAFLQGHAGDVNPGKGEPWRGEAEQTASAVVQAIKQAAKSLKPVAVEEMKSVSSQFEVPLDSERLQKDLATYEADPAKCNQGEWVDAEFAGAWYESAKEWDPNRATFSAPMSALRLGEVGLLFHPAELYSYYGLALRHRSPFKHTLAVGYADDLIGYLVDPKAYETGEYAAVVAPKILDLPPFATNAAQALVDSGLKLLEGVKG